MQTQRNLKQMPKEQALCYVWSLQNNSSSNSLTFLLRAGYANTDDEPSVTTLINGPNFCPVGRPGFLNHDLVLAFSPSPRLAELSLTRSQVYDHWDGVDQATSLPVSTPYLDVQNISSRYESAS